MLMLTAAAAVVLIPRIVIPAAPLALPGPSIPLHAPVNLPGLALPFPVKLAAVAPAPVKAPVPAIKQLTEMTKDGQAEAERVRLIIEGSKKMTLPEDDLLAEIGVER